MLYVRNFLLSVFQQSVTELGIWHPVSCTWTEIRWISFGSVYRVAPIRWNPFAATPLCLFRDPPTRLTHKQHISLSGQST